MCSVKEKLLLKLLEPYNFVYKKDGFITEYIEYIHPSFTCTIEYNLAIHRVNITFSGNSYDSERYFSYHAYMTKIKELAMSFDGFVKNTQVSLGFIKGVKCKT